MSAVTPIETITTPNATLSGIFQRRLEQFVAQREATSNSKERAMLKAAAFKLFLDAVDLGLIDDAQLILKQVNAWPAA
jgi:hypothetical protein